MKMKNKVQTIYNNNNLMIKNNFYHNNHNNPNFPNMKI